MKPNTFILGAPKCGTTALSEYLRAHPNVYMTTPKEPNFFCDDYDKIRYIRTDSDYLRLYDRAEDHHLVCGEASITYLASQTAVKNILRFNENARLIAMVRNPIDMLPSWHSQLLLNSDEDEPDLEKAFHLQEVRARGGRVPATCLVPEFLQYTKACKLGDQVERLLHSAPRHQLLVILFDDFVQDTRSVYENVLKFLGLPPDHRMEFPRINENKTLRYPRLSRLVASLARHWAGRKTQEILGKLNVEAVGRMKAAYYQKLTVGDERMALSPEFRKELVGIFRDDIDHLGALLDRDLSGWYV